MRFVRRGLLVFAACGAAVGCRRRATEIESRATDASLTIGADAARGTLAANRVTEAMAGRADAATSDVPSVAVADSVPSRPDAGPLLINASMGAFSIAHGTASGSGFGAAPHGPRVTAADPTIVGPLESTSVHLMLTAGQRYFRSCYETGLRRDRRLAGTALIRVVVGSTGDVTNAIVEGTTLTDREVASCVATIFLRSRFAPPRDGAAAIVTVPLSFEPGAR